MNKLIIFAFASMALAQWCDRPDGVTCVSPPYDVEIIKAFPNEILSVLTKMDDKNPELYLGGTGSGGRTLYYSSDAGSNFTTVAKPDGTVVALTFGASTSDLFLGSMWQDVPGVPSPPDASFAHSYSSGGSWSAFSLDGLPDSSNVASISQKGMHYKNGTLYMASLVQWPFYMDPWIDYYVTVSKDNGASYSMYPWGQGYPVFMVRFFDENNGVAIGGQHWEGDYSQPEPTIQEYVAVAATTNDGGRTWTQRFYNEKLYTFADIDCVGDRCWAVVMGLGYSIPDNEGRILYSPDRGVTWTEQFATMRDYDGGLMLYSIQMMSEQVGYAVGNFRMRLTVLVTYDGGNHWNYAWEPNSRNTPVVYDVYSHNGVLNILGYEMGNWSTGIYRLVSGN